MLFLVSSGRPSLLIEHHAGPAGNKLTHIQQFQFFLILFCHWLLVVYSLFTWHPLKNNYDVRKTVYKISKEINVNKQ